MGGKRGLEMGREKGKGQFCILLKKFHTENNELQAMVGVDGTVRAGPMIYVL